jgi:GTP-binding protein
MSLEAEFDAGNIIEGIRELKELKKTNRHIINIRREILIAG